MASFIEPLFFYKIGAQRSGSDLEKEEGLNGYAVFAALSQTAETKWSEFLPVVLYKNESLSFVFERKIKSIGRCCRAVRDNMT